MTELERVMHVDDDASIRTIAKVALERLGGFEVASHASGFDAIEQIEAFQPQVLLLDVMMPQIDGPETLKRMEEKTDLDTVMVIFMTAKVQPEEIRYYKSIGAFEVIEKPFQPTDLSIQLKKYWQDFIQA